MSSPSPERAASARRTVIAAAGAAGLTAALAACGNDGGGGGYGSSASSASSGSPSAEGSSPSGSSSGASSAPSESGGATKGGGALAKTSDIPAGGGKVFKDRKVVVTQPAKGDFKAFSAVCTHAGCLVGEVSGGTINCPCHGSKYAIADGSVRHGPATRGLSPVPLKVSGGKIKLT
ncbi:Rieske (2Fe-2S) protein [Streptomyces sp. Ru73]|uniref:Rieske (2Fe-2S) protein n=1 Tax=Streptomyces sp. Ru73 TaxID=2080748 RepID=UPI000CDD9EA7|nr:Rieske (2Fe-2S) protein [Streptomyces sp. Ru73]POX36305.1 Rieske (2Fe-2S) protein [Streptomyces sp. Ru73]